MSLWIDMGAATRAEALFGVPPVERLRRSAGKLLNKSSVLLSGTDAQTVHWPGARAERDDAPLGRRLRQALTRQGALVAVDGGNAIDPRLIDFMLAARGSCLAARGEGRHRAVVLRLEPELADAIPEQARDLRELADALQATGRVAPLDEATFPAYVNKLRRSLPYWIYAVPDHETRQRLERQMFWDNYKGSTDLLTRYVYPPLVWPLVRLCTRYRIHPNVVTVLSIVLTFAAVPLFARGDFWAGFICAYAMSVLDSVDGKLARVTLTDSMIGNVLDHGLDQVHPPFWYFAWALGLGAAAGDPLYTTAVWFVGLYVADRLVLAVSKRLLGYSLHAATPLDGRVRGFIARRNITMTIMLFAIAFGAGIAGFYLVTAWQALTLAWHAVRTVQLRFFLGKRLRPEA